MATCKNCLHVKVCREYVMGLAAARGVELDATEIEQVLVCDDCENFKDRSRFVELPCKVGDLIYIIKKARGLSVRGAKVNSITITESGKIQVSCYRSSFIGLWSDDAFATKEEAEQALKEREENAN